MIRLFAGALLLLTTPAAMAAEPAATQNDYPTATRVDYVIGCMAANGQTQDVMRRCSCRIDVIASMMPFKAYEQADTVLRMRGMTGETAALFRDVKVLRDVVDQLRVAQVEADSRCS